MDRLMNQLLEANTPKINSLVCGELIQTHLKEAERYIDNIFQISSESYPESLIYAGCERCTPMEEFLEVSKIRNNKHRFYDISESDVYLMKFKFIFNGEMLPPKYIYLPYVRDGGIIYLNGGRGHISPTLSDKIISPGHDSVFIKLIRYRVIFKKCYHAIMINGEREINNVIWADIYKKIKDRKVGITTKAKSCLVHYLLGKHGLKEMFETYCGFSPIVGNTKTITKKKYPEDKYVICKSSGVKPKDYIGMYYKHTEVVIAIPLKHWNYITKSLIVGVYYVIDNFSSRLNETNLDDVVLIKILLGHILHSGNYGENKLYADIIEHYNTLDTYVDSIVRDNLKKSNLNINNFYELMMHISSEFNNYISNSGHDNLSMYGKNLEVLYYVLYDLTSSIFNLLFKLNKRNGNKDLSVNNVKELLNSNLKIRTIHRLFNKKVFVESVEYPGDHKYFKLTSKLVEQEVSPKGISGKHKKTLLGSDKYLHISMIEGGTLLALGKANPTPVQKMNIYIKLDKNNNVIIPNEKFIDLIKITNQKLKGLI